PHRVAATLAFSYTDPLVSGLYTLSLHDALPISPCEGTPIVGGPGKSVWRPPQPGGPLPTGAHGVAGILGAIARGGAAHQSVAAQDRKSTRLNSSHRTISYAVFCLKKKNINSTTT